MCAERHRLGATQQQGGEPGPLSSRSYAVTGEACEQEARRSAGRRTACRMAQWKEAVRRSGIQAEIAEAKGRLNQALKVEATGRSQHPKCYRHLEHAELELDQAAVLGMAEEADLARQLDQS